MMRISISAPAVVLVAAALLVSNRAQAQSKDTFIGRWTNVTLTELRGTDPRCRYAEVMTRTYELTVNAGGMLQGSYLRMHEVVPISEELSCDAVARTRKIDARPRLDLWYVFEKPAGKGRVTLRGYKGDCTGRCDQSLASNLEFETALVSDGKRLTDMGSGSSDPPMLFAPDRELERDKREAAGAYLALLKPLLQGNCHDFFNGSLDGAAQRTLPQDVFCQLGAKMASLTPVIRVDMPLAAYAVTTGILSPPAGQTILLGSGDVFVKRFFVVGDNNAGIPMAGVLKKQGDGGWKILSIAPCRRRATAGQSIVQRKSRPVRRIRRHWKVALSPF